jgi:mycothiol synthase
MTQITFTNDVRLPEKFAHWQCRPLQNTLEDFAMLADLTNENEVFSGFPYHITAEELEEEYTHDDKFDMQTMTRVFLEDGRMVASVSIDTTLQPHVRNFLSWNLRPQYYGHGVEEALCAWAEQFVIDNAIPKAPEHAMVITEFFTLKDFAPDIEPMKKLGYQEARYFYRMLIKLDEMPTVPPIADGFSIRALRYPEDLEVYAEARRSAFRDHYGYVEQPLDVFIERAKPMFEKDDKMVNGFSYFAVENTTGKIAAFSINRIEEWGQPEHAYVAVLGTVPEFRGKGLALNVLRHSFMDAYQRDKRSMTLHVDASSITGAVRLYERAGMHIDYVEVSLKKILRDGEDLMRTGTEGD